MGRSYRSRKETSRKRARQLKAAPKRARSGARPYEGLLKMVEAGFSVALSKMPSGSFKTRAVRSVWIFESEGATSDKAIFALVAKIKDSLPKGTWGNVFTDNS